MDTLTKPTGPTSGPITGTIPGIEKLPPGFQPNQPMPPTQMGLMDKINGIIGDPVDPAKQEKMALVNQMMKASAGSLFKMDDPGRTFLHRR